MTLVSQLVLAGLFGYSAVASGDAVMNGGSVAMEAHQWTEVQQGMELTQLLFYVLSAWCTE